RRHARTACKRGHAERLRLPGAPPVPRGTYATVRGREASAPVCLGDTQQCQQCPAMTLSSVSKDLRMTIHCRSCLLKVIIIKAVLYNSCVSPQLIVGVFELSNL